MKRVDLQPWWLTDPGKKPRRQKVDRIPDAVLDDNSVSHCENRHGNASRQAAFHSGRDRVDFKGQSRPMQLMCPPNRAAPRRDGW